MNGIIIKSQHLVKRTSCLLYVYSSKNLGNIHRYTPIILYPTAQLYNIIIILDTVLSRNEFLNVKDNELNSAAIALLLHARQGFAGASLTWPVYVGCRKRDNCSV